ncbi:MAG: hypothetical protein ABR585_02340 [Gemmatimonadaceae bacterium]
MRTVYIVIGCDTDPDRASLLPDVPSDRLSWKGMTNGIPLLKNSLRTIRDARGGEPVFTWLLRADEQIRDMLGDYAAVAREHGGFLRELERSGDELGWHPHFWRREKGSGRWFQEVQDRQWQIEMLHEAHKDLAACLPGGVKSVRMGWDYHNNQTFQTLEELGVVVDFSAVPGLRTFVGAPPTRGENCFDWHSSPRIPFKPSRADYRRPPKPGAAASRLLEIPTFVSVSRVWSFISGVQLARKTRILRLLWDSIRRPTYWINITARRELFAPLVSQMRRALLAADTQEPLVFATYFHPDELLPNRSRLYDLASVRTNLEALLGTCDNAGARVEFVQARKIPALLAAAI